MILELQEVARAMAARSVCSPAKVTGWSVDTRTQNPGDLYFALRGPNHDGHEFAAAAIEKGAVAVVVEHSANRPDRELVVEDTLLALQRLGAWARKRWGGRIVAVTGSAGKTTTKDAVAHLLASRIPTGKTIGNFNNHVGVPLSILRLPDESQVAVLEIGMNHPGEIRELAALAEPEVGVVTNVGYAHVEFFDSIEGVAAAKRELVEGLPPDGVAVLNADDPRVARFGQNYPGRTVTFGLSEQADVRAEIVQYLPTGTRFRALGVDFETVLTGRHAVLNLLAALTVASIFDIPAEDLKQAVATFTVGKMRGERIEHHGVVIWNDCYNSNPEAVEAMIDVLHATPATRHIAVLGEMLELGEAAEPLHFQVGRYAVKKGVDALVAVRGKARAMVDAFPKGSAWFFEDPAEAGDFVRQLAKPGDAVLFKGSRGVRVERALERFVLET